MLQLTHRQIQYRDGSPAFREGWEDFGRDLNPCYCPYSKDTIEAKDWSAGYDAASLDHDVAFGGDYD